MYSGQIVARMFCRLLHASCQDTEPKQIHPVLA